MSEQPQQFEQPQQQLQQGIGQEGTKPTINFRDKIVIHQQELEMKFESALLKTKPYVLYRWIFFFVLFFLFLVKMIAYGRYYTIAYIAGLYIVNSLILFLSPKLDPEIYGNDVLPTLGDSDYKPFVRKLPEFLFWQRITGAALLAHFCSFFKVFDPPVYGKILLLYFIVVFVISFNQRIMHMIRNNYVPFTLGKNKAKKNNE
ncbi:Protein RER1B [Tritrichomonas foetus]|uniref:Protein RER1 n=1 Tax=Tritrichomonas foetus TaxID=1144522 RepID=A0A1J4JRY1_9EUKA|nr:Protein RER1B [Tritrichomonas foetus]|eukprot:OHT01881.1 Protein RER1B [Tritrichomonas foetus]